MQHRQPRTDSLGWVDALRRSQPDLIAPTWQPTSSGRVLRADLVCAGHDDVQSNIPGASGRGRGTAIMRAAMDEVEVSTHDGGTEVVMRRSVRSAAPA